MRWSIARGKLTSFLASPLQWAITSSFLYSVMVGVQFFGRDQVWAAGPKSLFIAVQGISANVVASFILYYLVVFVPEFRKRARLRKNCRRMYRALKRELIYDILSASWQGGRKDLDFDSDQMERLMNPPAFRSVFEEGNEADEGFYAFSNHIQNNEKQFRSIIFKFRMIARQLEFVLNNCEIPSEAQFSLLKRLEQSLFSLGDLHAGYEEEKTLSKVIWEVFAGWSWVDGYRDYDVIEKAIDAI